MELDINEITRLLCVKRKITVAELSVKLGKSKQNLFNKLYRGDMKLSELRRIADMLEIDLDITFTDRLTGESIVKAECK